MTRVSIVTISFNQAEFLERTILSVLDQDYPDIEYIVVDPGSCDGSREIIERYRPRITSVIYQPDSGPPDGLNHGFAHSSGEILAFLNSDDVLTPGAVSAAVRYLERNNKIDVVSGHSNLIAPDDRFLRRLYSDRMSITRFIYGGCILIQPSTFYRRSIFERTPRFNVNNKVNFDGELFLEMALLGAKFAVVDEYWSGYRIHDRSLTGSTASAAKIRQARSEMFKLVKGRVPNQLDGILELGFRYMRKLMNPRDTWQRLTRGRVYGRGVN